MTNRYYYSTDELTEKDLKGAFNFSKRLLRANNRMHIFVNVKKNAPELLNGMFESTAIHKMTSGSEVEIDGTSVSIKSIATFDKHQHYDVALVVHGSEYLLSKLESSGRTANIVVFVNEMDAPNEWLKNEHTILSAENHGKSQ